MRILNIKSNSNALKVFCNKFLPLTFAFHCAINADERRQIGALYSVIQGVSIKICHSYYIIKFIKRLFMFVIRKYRSKGYKRCCLAEI